MFMKWPHLILLLIAFQPLLSKPIEIDEALKKGLIAAEINGAGPNSGPSIRLKVFNKGNAPLTLNISPGWFLMPDDTLVQRMLVTNTEQLQVSAGDTASTILIAMCSEKNDVGPGTDDRFTMGTMASGSLLKLSRLLDEKDIQDDAAQNAVWAITDSVALSTICGTEHSATLLEFFSSLGNYAIPKCEMFEGAGKAAVFRMNGSFTYTIMEPTKINLAVFDADGEIIITLIEDEVTGGESYQYDYHMEIPKPDAGEQYYLRLYFNGKMKSERVLNF